jgi:hypothetical protein
LKEKYYRLLTGVFMWCGRRLYRYHVARKNSEGKMTTHFADSERTFTISIRELVEELDEHTN